MDLDSLITKQAEELEGLLSKADSIRKSWRGVDMSGDRIDYIFTGDITFLQLQNNSQDITFQIPENTDFYGTRLMLQPFARFVTIDQPNQGPDELNFRPVVFSTTEGVFNNSPGAGALGGVEPLGVMSDIASVDCMVSITESMPSDKGEITRSYQNIPTPVQFFYSGGVNYGSGTNYWDASNVTYFPDFQIPTGLMFPVDYFLPKGSAVTLKITPIFAQERLPAGVQEAGVSNPTVPVEFNRQTEYQIRAFLQGYKIAGDKAW